MKALLSPITEIMFKLRQTRELFCPLLSLWPSGDGWVIKYQKTPYYYYITTYYNYQLRTFYKENFIVSGGLREETRSRVSLFIGKRPCPQPPTRPSDFSTVEVVGHSPHFWFVAVSVLRYILPVVPENFCCCVSGAVVIKEENCQFLGSCHQWGIEADRSVVWWQWKSGPPCGLA